VGTWPRASDVTVTSGYPSGLLEPVLLDTVWTNAAVQILAPANARERISLTDKLLRRLYPDETDSVWRKQAWMALQDLISGRTGNTKVGFLRFERLAVAFGRSVENRDLDAALAAANRILSDADDLGISARERLIWYLRRRLVRQMSGIPPTDSEQLWPMLKDLGPFDSVNAWALWAACRRANGLAVLPEAGDQTELAGVMSRLPAGSVSAAELYASALPQDAQSALGAILLKKNELGEHFKKFPHPPASFTRQGQWVRGQRRLRRGLAGSYEQLAERRGLAAGWQMDILRRASELRVRKGAWVEGLADLRQALTLAERGSGTAGLRRRLRQWTEQALVLALAHDDLRTARELRDLGLAHFSGKEQSAFLRDIEHWTERLGHRGPGIDGLRADSVDRARRSILSGGAPDLSAAVAAEQTRFRNAADRELWPVWRKWGTALADPARVTGEKRTRAASYQDYLAAWRGADSGLAAADSAFSLVGLRLGDRPWVTELLRTTLDVDVGRVCGWQTPPRRSPIPDLLAAVRGSELDRHALLGFCLAIGDMRGILGLAYELPARGLTRAEKRLFLYPLPPAGAIRDAIGAAASEPALLLAVARNESLFEPAVRSRAGALGWMQIMPFHFPEKGSLAGARNWRVPALNVQRGDALLSENRRRYGGDPYRTVAAYNAGPGAADRWDRQLGGQAARDLYLAWIGYPETRAYVEKVLIDREIYHEIIRAQDVLPASRPTAGSANE